MLFFPTLFFPLTKLSNNDNSKACLFDLDGVIVDTAVYHFQAWRRLANELGFDFTEHQNEQLKGISRMESLELILNWGGVTLTEEEKVAWYQKNQWYLDLVMQMTPNEVLPGVPEFLKSLRANGIKIALFGK
jgi:beta-phosphoglucomutase